MSRKVPIIDAYLFYKLKEHLPGNRSEITLKYAKEILRRNLRLIPGGIPNCFINEIIAEMIEYNLLIKKDFKTLIVRNHSCQDKIKRMLSLYY